MDLQQNFKHEKKLRGADKLARIPVKVIATDGRIQT